MNAAIPPRFDLRNLRAPWHVGSDGWVDASVKVRNVGRRSGDDTVLAFVVRPDGGRQLVAFPRVRLDRATGPACGWPFAVTQPSGERAVTPGTYRLVVGNLSQTFRVG